MTAIWQKAYKGPFTKDTATKHAKSLKGEAIYPNPEKIIIDARTRLRRKPKKTCVCTAACGAGLGHNKMYDVWIKIDVLHARSIS